MLSKCISEISHTFFSFFPSQHYNDIFFELYKYNGHTTNHSIYCVKRASSFSNQKNVVTGKEKNIELHLLLYCVRINFIYFN